MCLAVPGRIQETSGEGSERYGRVSFGGILKDVNLAYVPEAKQGDYVIVHVGFALSTLDEDEANKIFEYLHQMNELEGINDHGTSK